MQLLALFAMPVALAVAVAPPALAASSAWTEAEGARIRLVTTGAPDAAGSLRGSLEIALEPGWKTYWQDPGEAGVPPSLDVSASEGVRAASLAFPAPGRHDDGDFVWAGYDKSLALPITFQVDEAAPKIAADVFLGVCETICIPLKARLVVDPLSDPENAADKDAVDRAFAALPAPAGPDFGVVASRTEGQTAVIETKVPGDPLFADLFLAGVDGYVFSTPRKEIDGDHVRFTVEVEPPAAPKAGSKIPYTLIGENGAASGMLTLF